MTCWLVLCRHRNIASFNQLILSDQWRRHWLPSRLHLRTKRHNWCGFSRLCGSHSSFLGSIRQRAREGSSRLWAWILSWINLRFINSSCLCLLMHNSLSNKVSCMFRLNRWKWFLWHEWCWFLSSERWITFILIFFYGTRQLICKLWGRLAHILRMCEHSMCSCSTKLFHLGFLVFSLSGEFLSIQDVFGSGLSWFNRFSLNLFILNFLGSEIRVIEIAILLIWLRSSDSTLSRQFCNWSTIFLIINGVLKLLSHHIHGFLLCILFLLFCRCGLWLH